LNQVLAGVAMLQGYPFNINDLKILLDKRVYEYMDCRWMDLFNRMKWDTIKSVLKSVTGLQGRKFKVCFCLACAPLLQVLRKLCYTLWRKSIL
jgi:hypothetical protein